MKQYMRCQDILKAVKNVVKEQGLVLVGNPEIEMVERCSCMERGSFSSFYFRIMSEKIPWCRRAKNPCRMAVYFHVTRHENDAYSLYVSYDW